MAVTKSTNDRGYDARHQRERAGYQQQMESGATFQCVCERERCTKHDGRCPTIITKSVAWDLGHNEDRSDWTGVECVPCNRSEGGKNGNKVARANSSTFETVDRGWL